MLPALMAAAFVMLVATASTHNAGRWAMDSDICAKQGSGVFDLHFVRQHARIEGRAACAGDGFFYEHFVDAFYPVHAVEGGYLYEDPPFVRMSLDDEGRIRSYDDYNDLFGASVHFLRASPPP